ncbi:protein LAZY 1 isoform X2 [Diospyros lotus]|uniref:protein LAZY 1 isoform X2 n=1 Tax=Diospyros lotus TaxID=55363 RepID=UPI00225ACEAF|nr:protein LAZY 1 isoform X2 [Diospyros lotus]
MKLLGWMHRKFRSSEPLKDFAIGQQSLDDQQYYPKSSYGIKPLGKAQRDNHLRKSFASLEAARAEDDDFEEDSSAAMSELFHGFLMIGTLGSDPVVTDPSTPTFAISVENITGKETEVTENELKLINDELEKVLGAEVKEDGCNDSSGRNSHVSTGRSSQGSTITLSGKPLEGTDASGNGATICPLQGYLFGSAIELPETTTAVKKEHRTSLGELFQRTKLEEINYVTKNERGEKRTENETDKSTMHLMKKMLKKRMVHSSLRSSTTPTGHIESASTETKLHKILHLFHRKVHPESSTAARKYNKAHKNDSKNNISNEGAYNSGERMIPSEDSVVFPHALQKESTRRRFKGHSNPPQLTLSGNDSNGNREHWIKTDGDYLVLEL